MRLKQVSIRTTAPKKNGTYAAKLVSNDGREDLRIFTKYRPAETHYVRSLTALLQAQPIRDVIGNWIKLTEASLFQVRTEDASIARIELGFSSSACLFHSDHPALIRIHNLFEKRNLTSVYRCRASSHTHDSTFALQIFTLDGREDLKVFDCRQKAEGAYFRAAAACLQGTFVQTTYGTTLQLRDARLWKVRNDDYELVRSEILRGKATRILHSADSYCGTIEIPDLFRPWKVEEEDNT